nr:DUF2827 family protein [Polymorphobacter sp.]
MTLRIGVTFSRPSDDETDLLWSSGIGQNSVLLVLLLQRLAGVTEVVVVDCSGKPAPHPLAAWCGVQTATDDDAADRLDLIIECGMRAPAETMHRFRQRGGRLVSYMAGNSMAMNFEALASAMPHGETVSAVPFDAVWITPQHWTMNRASCLLTRSAVVEQVPHIWEPIFVEARARKAGFNPFYKADTANEGFRVGILEPNVNVLKTFHLPLLVCEEAFRLDPGAIDHVLLFNTSGIKLVPHFLELTSSLDLFRAGKLFAEGRMPIAEVLHRHIDAVVVHQWQNDLNYLYWDVLWSGHPLIHNSPSIEGVGYAYASFDSADGGRALVDATRTHRGRAAAARAEALEFLDRFSIDSPEVRARHEDLIAGVMA